MGAHLIEKHFTLDKTMEGPDHSASIEPHEMVELVSDIRTLERAFGNGVKKIVGSESQNKQCMQKSLVACKTIKIGEVITKDFITCKRPGTGLKPLWLDSIVGKKAAKNILKDEILTLSSIIWD
jgi:N,N'-diacetyllegionaminate synthase